MFPNGYEVRPASLDDVDAAGAVLRACDLHDVGFSDGSEVWIRDDWVASSHRGAWIVEAASGEVCAFAALEAHDVASNIDAFFPVLPEHRSAVRPALVAFVEERARAIGADTTRLLMNVATTEGAGDVLVELGFAHVRVFWHMQRAVDRSFRAIEPPGGVRIRPFVPGDDDRLSWELLEASFADHFGQDPASFEAFRHDVLESDTWEPGLAAIAELDGEPVGIVTGFAVEETGWVGDLGVLASARGRGVGRALLEHEFALLAARGFERLQLNVDSQNETGAPGLYAAAGMTVRRSFDCYEKRLGPE